MLEAWTSESPSDEQARILARQNELIEQFIAADYVFIFSPLHNFNITSRTKDYFDNIFIAKRTFRYTSNGSEGLLNNSKRVVYVQTSGGQYGQDMRYIQIGLAPLYVRGIMNFMGINGIDIVRMEGSSRSSSNLDVLYHKAVSELRPLVERI